MSIKTLKSLGDIGNLHDLKTAGSARKSGKPALPTTAILELYMRRNERDRLVKETLRLKKRGHQIDRRLQEIEKEMNRLYEDAAKMAAQIRGKENDDTEQRTRTRIRGSRARHGRKFVVRY